MGSGRDRKGNSMKVEELEGALLDYWVGKSEGFLSEYNPYEPENGALAFDERIGTQIRIMGPDSRLCWVRYKPSTDWAQGGPIIERERIVTFPDGKGGWAAFVQASPNCGYVDTSAFEEIRGPTLLISAMRAYVAAKFGDEVADDTKQLDSVQTQL